MFDDPGLHEANVSYTNNNVPEMERENSFVRSCFAAWSTVLSFVFRAKDDSKKLGYETR